MHQNNWRHMYKDLIPNISVLSAYIHNISLFPFVTLDTVFTPYKTTLPDSSHLQDKLYVNDDNHSKAEGSKPWHQSIQCIYWTVKHITVMEKTKLGKIQVLPFFSADNMNTVSMLHSLHEGLDWWGKKELKSHWCIKFRVGDKLVTQMATQS